MKDDRKSKRQLTEEIEQLRRQLAEDRSGSSEPRQPTFGKHVSRRAALKMAWAAPVVLSVPIASVVGSPRRAIAGTTQMPPTRRPTQEPTTEPTVSGPGGPVAPTAFVPAADAPLLSGGAAAVAAGALFGIGAKYLASDSGDDDPEDEA